MNNFTGKDAMLEQAIDADSAAGVEAAVRGGAHVNARGAHGVTPLEYAVGHLKKAAYTELLRLKADPNQRDDEKDNAITLAVSAYKRDRDFLLLALKAGGDPNTRRPDGNPILIRFVNDRNLEGIRLLRANGASIDVNDRSDDPLILAAGAVEDWDVVWCFLELGAKYDFPESRFTWAKNFGDPRVTPPDSPIHPYKVKAWQFFKDHGVAVPKSPDSKT